MPALPQLTSVAGGLLSGGAPLNMAEVAQGMPGSPPVVVQSSTASTSASGPASFTQTVTATKVGSLLVWFVAVSASAGAALGATPAGWTLAWSQVQGTLALGCYIQPLNPGGITTVTLSSPTATAGGIAGAFFEVANCPYSDVQTQNAQGSSSAMSSGTLLVPMGNQNIVLGAVAWVLGAATDTPANVALANAAWTSLAQASSTGGATNNATLIASSMIQTSQVATAATGCRVAGTLSGSAVWNAGCLSLRSTGSDNPVNAATGAIPVDTLVGGGPGGYSVTGGM